LLGITFLNPLFESQFPKLKNLNLESKVLWTPSLGALCKELIPNLKAKEVFFQNDKLLEGFFKNLRVIPHGKNVVLAVNLVGIGEETWISYLKKYIQDVKVEGNLEIEFENAEVKDIQAFMEVFEMAVDKGCFQKLRVNSLNHSKSFTISKNTIIGVGWSITVPEKYNWPLKKEKKDDVLDFLDFL